VAHIKQEVEMHGRDPEAFGFGVWIVSAMHEDPEVIDRALENPMVKAFAGLFGRFQPKDWLAEGISPVTPDGFHYALHWTPEFQDAGELKAMVDRVSPEMVAGAVHRGSPAEIAAKAKEFVEAGATYVATYDMLPLVLDPAEHPAAFGRNLQMLKALKS
jgi:phthiodiolone/phenolphthiodiolone dimycocerosates ketoreductase